MKVFNLETVGSTMDYCREQLRAGLEEVCVVAKEQTKGRGQSGKSWSSVPGQGLYFTYGCAIEKPVEALSLTVGWFLSELLLSKGVHCRLKWPNDLYVKDRKLGGVLVEVENKILCVGVGINYVAPEGLNAEGLSNLGITELGFKQECIDAVRGAVRAHQEAGFKPFAAVYTKRMLWLGTVVKIGSFEGELQGVTDTGRLVLSGKEFLSGSPTLLANN